MPFFTVLICTYQRAELLTRAIESVLAQTFQDFEIVVVDDGSEQDIERILESLGDNRIKFFRMETNRGVAAAANLGFSKAKGRYVSTLDDDDELYPSFLEETRLHLLQNDLDFCWCGIEEHFPEGRSPRETMVQITQKELYYRQMVAVLIGTGFGFTLRRQCWNQVPGFDVNLRTCADVDFFLELVQRPLTWAGLPKVLVKVYRQLERLTLFNERYARSLEYIVRKHQGFLAFHKDMNAALHFQLGTLLADANERSWARQSLWRYLKHHPFDGRMWMIFLSNEMRHNWFGLKILQVYRWFYHRLGAPFG